MAEVTAFRNNALPYPIYAQPWAVTFPMLDADGDLVAGATTPDAEVSKNGDTFADCTNESVEIATASGVYYLLLTAAEMTADIVTVIAKSATAGMKTTVLTFYPRKLVVLSSGTCQGSNDTGDIQLASGDSAIDDYYNGCIVVAVIDTVTEVRMINDYVGSTKVAEVSPAWNTAQPDSNDTYTIYLPAGRQVNQANTTHVGGTVQTARDIGASVLLSSGTGTGQLKLASGYVAMTWADIAAPTTTVNLSGTTVKTATDVETDTADIQSRLPAALVSGRMDSSVGAMAANTLTASALAADAVTEIRDAITGGAYALSTDANGRLRIVDGTGAGELDTLSGTVLLRSATQASIDAIEADTNELQTDWANGGRLDNILDARSSQTSVDDLPTNAELATALGTADDAVLAAIAALNNITAASVWAVGTRALTSLGFTLTASDLAADTITAAKVAADVSTEIRNAITGGAYALDTDSNGRIRIVDGAGAGEIDTSSGAIARVVLADTVTTYTGNTPQTGDSFARIGATGSGLTSLASAASIAALNNLSTAQVLAQVETALASTTRTMPGQATPSATPTLAEALMQLFQLQTNPADQDSSTQRIYNRAGDTVHQKRTVADDTVTTSLGALVTGP